MRICRECGGQMKEVANLVVKVPHKSDKGYSRRKNLHRFKCVNCGYEETHNIDQATLNQMEKDYKDWEKADRKKNKY